MPVKVSDGDGCWISSDGTLMTTVWTNEGFIDLPDEYEVVGNQDADDGLTLSIMYNGRVIRVQGADFE